MNIRLVFAACCAALWAGPASLRSATPSRPPNIIFILADDLGYAELGCYGQKKIQTPNLERMAAQGIRLTQHYSGSAVCAPSRCVLMTGKHPGHAWVRNNREVQPEGQFSLPPDTPTLARLLQQRGYATAAMGKWGLGGPGSPGEPLRQGFGRFFGYNCQRHAHNYYPTYLWDNERRVTLKNPEFAAHQRLASSANPNDPDSYKAFVGSEYSPDLIGEQARQFIRENARRPFFLYLATTVPHLALQAPEDSLREYLGRWPDPPYTGTNGYLPHYAPRAAYAAMVTRLDREVGRICKLVEELGLDEQTIFVFTSDNGPTYGRLGGSDSDFFQSTAGLRGLKGSLYEGGVRVPAIVRWKGRLGPGRVSDCLTGFEDWLPTLLELAGLSGTTPQGLDGISFALTLLGGTQPPRPFLYREFPGYGGQQSVRFGDWKAVRQGLTPRADAPPRMHIELYNLAQDPGESRDLSEAHSDLVARLERLMREQHAPSSHFPMPALDQQQ